MIALSVLLSSNPNRACAYLCTHNILENFRTEIVVILSLEVMIAY